MDSFITSWWFLGLLAYFGCSTYIQSAKKSKDVSKIKKATIITWLTFIVLFLLMFDHYIKSGSFHELFSWFVFFQFCLASYASFILYTFNPDKWKNLNS